MKKIIHTLGVSTMLASSLLAVSNDALEQRVLELEKIVAESTTSNSGLSSDIFSNFSFGGYGKVDYTHFRDRTTTPGSAGADQVDNFRAVFYVGYQFSDSVFYHSEIEFEHGDAVEVEQNYLEWLLSENFSLNFGTQIVPMGYVNLHHEPSAFNGVARPEVERHIIPSTWFENGILAKGSAVDGVIEYQVGAFASLDANKGIEVRNMRSVGSKSKAEDIAYVARVDAHLLDDSLLIGASYFMGEADQDNNLLSGVDVDIFDIHAVFNAGAFTLKGLYAQANIDNANKVAMVNSASASGGSNGGYIDASYAVGDFTPFVRYEKYNRFNEKFNSAGTMIASDEYTENIVVGTSYALAENAVLKADYMNVDSGTGTDDRISLGAGWNF